LEALWPIFNRIPFFGLVLIRVGAMVFSTPVFGAKSLPMTARAGLILAFSWALLPLLPLPSSDIPFELIPWGVSAIREALIGFCLGWFVQLVLAAVSLAGQTLGFQMGFAIANVLDPVQQQQLSIIAQFLNTIGIWVFLAMDGHHIVLSGLFESYRASPLWSWDFLQGMGALSRETGTHLFRSALLLAAPIVLILVFLSVAFGIMARAVPQMNVFFVGMPLKIALGFMAFGTLLGFVAPWMSNNLEWLHNVLFFLGKAS
jgi:flagellar biosynthetic protein FliR